MRKQIIEIAIEFAEWIAENGYILTANIDDNNDRRWTQPKGGIGMRSPDLFEAYLKEKGLA